MKTDLTVVLVFVLALVLYLILNFLARKKQNQMAFKPVQPSLGNLLDTEEQNYTSDQPIMDEHESANLFSKDKELFADNDLKLEPAKKPASATQTPKVEANNVKPTAIIALNIFAKKDHTFMGYDLLQTLLAAGLRFGEMSIFHRYAELNQQTVKLFSLARATNPGVFDINNMGNVDCKGLILFMQLTDREFNHKAFKLMHATAQLLAEELNGELLDDQRQPLTPAKLSEYQTLLDSV
ncbi:MAG: cell division protein ZipA [Pseudomonadota bacterium]